MSRNKMSSFYLQKKKVLQVENKKGKKKQGESTKEKHSLIYMEKKKSFKRSRTYNESYELANIMAAFVLWE